MTEREKVIYDFMIANDIELKEVLDVVVKSNGIVGAGLVTFGQGLEDYITSRIQASATPLEGWG